MVLPWTEEVLVRLAERLTEEFLESEEEIVRYLPLLFFGESAEAHAMRYAYMDAVSELWSENFDGMIADWCHRHNVRHIGHTIEDNNAVARLGYGAGHYFRALAHADMAGIDVVMQQLMPGYDKGLFRAFHKPGWDAEFFTYVLGKIGSSLAHIDPAKHGACMAEVFGAYGWEEGLPLMKYLADYMLVRGVNYFVPHAFSPKAFPDGDCPPHLYAHGMNPQYPELKVLMDYMNRLAALLSGGTYAAPVALYFNAEGNGRETGSLRRSLPVSLPAASSSMTSSLQTGSWRQRQRRAKTACGVSWQAPSASVPSSFPGARHCPKRCC